MHPVHAGIAGVDLQGNALEHEKAPVGPPATIAELWSLFDAAAARTTRALQHDRRSAEITQTRNATERRYLLHTVDGTTRYIAILPLVPSVNGSASCGAFLAASDSARTLYVEPTPEHTWTVPASGDVLDMAAVTTLFGRVFEGEHVPAGS